MNRDRIQRINADLLDRTGIDFSRYRDPQLAAAVADAMTFPLYLGRSLVRPVGSLLLLAVLAFVMTDSAFVKSFLVFPGLALVIVNGVLLGLVLFVGRIGRDLQKIFDISCDLCVQALKDIGAARTQVRSRGGFPGALEIFQGINAIVVLPIVVETLKRRVPFLGGAAALITERFFGLADRRLAAVIARRAPGTPPPAEPTPADVSGWLDSAEGAVHAMQSGSAKILDAVKRAIAFPFVGMLFVVALVSLGLLYGAYALAG